jgi:hypothetical protein
VWITETLDSEGDVGTTPSIAVGPDDNIHICYYDVGNYDLKYATKTASGWSISTIDSAGNVGAMASIAVDNAGKVHISYLDAGNADLKYATNVHGTWEVTVVDSDGSVGWYSDIALDSNGAVHISYMDVANNDLKYATNAGGSWVSTRIDSAEAGWWTRIAVDSKDFVHITYCDITTAASHPRYASNAGGQWSFFKFNSTFWGFDGAIAIDSQDDVHILYSGGDAGRYDLHYVTDHLSASSMPLYLTTLSGTEQVSLIWEAPACNGGSEVTSYGVYREVLPGLFEEVGNTSTLSLSYTDRFLENGTLFRYRVTARNSIGESLPSEISESYTNFRPAAHFDVSPAQGDITTAFVFDASTSHDEEDSVKLLKIRWDWESDGIWDTIWDSTWSTNKTVTHGYSSLGSYDVRLGVMDTGGLTDATSLIIEVLNTAPIAIADVYPDLGYLHMLLTFDASMSFDLEDPMEALECRWDWEGDGIWDTDWSANKTAEHMFPAAGSYTVRLEVRDSMNMTNTTVMSVEVLDQEIPEFGALLLPVMLFPLLVVVSSRIASRKRRMSRI